MPIAASTPSPQLDSITAILRRHAQPTLGDSAQAATANLVGQIDPNNLKAPGSVTPQGVANANAQAEAAPELGILDVMNKAQESGSQDARTVMDAFKQVAPDPDQLSKLLVAAHDDPEQITPANAATWAARKAQELALGGGSQVEARKADAASKNPAAMPWVDTGGNVNAGGSGTVADLLGPAAGGSSPVGPDERILPTYGGKPAASGYMWVQSRDGQVRNRIIPGGPKDPAADPKMKAQKFKATSAVRTLHDKTTNVIGIIDKILPRIGYSTAGMGSYLGKIPGTTAYDVAADLDSIKANIGFNELAEMRANSPTGGALGNVSDNEGRLLQSVLANLQTGQSPEQLKSNLENVKKVMVQSWNRVRGAYDEQYGGGSPAAVKAPAAPPAPAATGWNDADEKRLQELEAKAGGR